MSYEIRNYLNRRQAIGMRDEWREGYVDVCIYQLYHYCLLSLAPGIWGGLGSLWRDKFAL